MKLRNTLKSFDLLQLILFLISIYTSFAISNEYTNIVDLKISLWSDFLFPQL